VATRWPICIEKERTHGQTIISVPTAPERAGKRKPASQRATAMTAGELSGDAVTNVISSMRIWPDVKRQR
jgi:hypothetical protein